ncbi:hypothetical protein [Niabella ginsengisoli]|uniref:SMP-30/Gluconolactonase/LRE-like region domain-containing protein n=1 Tax=Niabella ginsengisoli TaxID=522298 RepID=A0ABS9SKZ5_9BACT|nr:hypothetical protein [Niabella ginsengisoli]MCH5598834.1 hypothetical protein [Niabella ginsengisoli]
MKIHPNGKSLYVLAGDVNYSRFTSQDTRKKMARLISIDLSSGRRNLDIDLSTLISGKHFPNDVVFDQAGNAYITDSYAHAIYKLAPDGTPSLFAKNKIFVTEGLGLMVSFTTLMDFC